MEIGLGGEIVWKDKDYDSRFLVKTTWRIKARDLKIDYTRIAQGVHILTVFHPFVYILNKVMGFCEEKELPWGYQCLQALVSQRCLPPYTFQGPEYEKAASCQTITCKLHVLS